MVEWYDVVVYCILCIMIYKTVTTERENRYLKESVLKDVIQDNAKLADQLYAAERTVHELRGEKLQ